MAVGSLCKAHYFTIYANKTNKYVVSLQTSGDSGIRRNCTREQTGTLHNGNFR